MASDSFSSTDAWTKVGKGGRPVSFPPEAASAFGRRGPASETGTPYRSYGGRSEFPTAASAAFGRGPARSERSERPERFERSERADFDSGAAAAFSSVSGTGGRAHREPRSGAPEFDQAAVSAFGSGGSGGRRLRDDDGGGGGFPSAFGKKKSLFAEAAELGFAEGGNYGHSALARKRAEAARPPPAKPRTYEEMFPTLGAPAAAPPTRSAADAPSAPASAPKRTFADLMRERVATEEAEAAHEATEREREIQRREVEMIDRDQIRRLYSRRVNAAAFVHSSSSADDELDAPEAEVNYTTHDLDYDVYGASKTAFSTVSPPHAHADEDEGEEEGGTYNEDLY